MQFSEKVKEVRKQLNLTQAALAKELGIARATLIRWETGAFKPNYDAQRRFENFCEEKGVKENRK